MYLPAELNLDDYIPKQSITWLQEVTRAFEELWQDRRTKAETAGCLPSPVSTGEVRAHLLASPIPNKKAQKPMSVINALSQLAKTDAAVLRKIRRPGQKASLWAPIKVSDDQLDFSEAYTNDSERIGEAVQRAVERLSRPVNIRDIKEEIKLDAALHPRGSSNIYEILADLSKERVGIGKGIRRERASRRIFRVGRISGVAYFYHSGAGLDDARFYVEFNQIKSQWIASRATEQFADLENCSLPSIALGRASLIEADATKCFQQLKLLLDRGYGDEQVRREAEILYDDVKDINDEIRDWHDVCSFQVKDLPKQVSTEIPTWTSHELLSVLKPLYPSAQKLTDPNRLVGLLKWVRRVSNSNFTRRFSRDRKKAVEYVFDRTDALLFAAKKWGGHECCFQALLAKSHLGLLRDIRFILPVLKRKSFEDRLIGVACLAFVWTHKSNGVLRKVALSDSNPSVRQSALWAYCFAGGHDTSELLQDRIKNDIDVRVRAFAKEILKANEESLWLL